MAQELLRDVLRPADSARTRRRMWLLPLSIAAHAAAIGALIIIPLGAAVGLPTPESVIRMVQVQPPPVPPIPTVPPAGARTRVAQSSVPTEAPATIADEAPAPAPNPSDFGVPLDSALAAGVTGLGTTVAVDVPVVPPPPPALTQPVRPGGLIREPRKLVHVAPEYPQIARISRTQGSVVLEAVLDERGHVDQVRVLKSVPLLDESAVRAVRGWRYTPTLLNGVPVKVLMTITVTFHLN